MVRVAEFEAGVIFVQSPVKIGEKNSLGTNSVTVKEPGPNITV
ncbi:MAG TPA: hypothetical protein VE223_01355 [Nitrososphaeraceae archaeon]|nr:hypothetical protein [Nitrososphaeraceae archaeon]